MVFKGGSIKGARYGQTNPKDYTGLVAWWHLREGLSYYRGDLASSLADLSGIGAGKMLTPPSGVTNIGRVANTPYGLGLYATSGGNSIGLTGPNGAFGFLSDGSPFTHIAIMKNVTNSSGISIGSNNAGNISSLGLGWQPPSSFRTLRLYNAAGTNIISNGNMTMPAGNCVEATVCYGYNNGVTPPMVSYHNGSVLQTHTYNSAPSPAPVNSRFQLNIVANPNQLSYLYEMIIYNNTGKAKAQIDFEMNALYNNYIKVKYKNFV
jgi:hypothetical protein